MELWGEENLCRALLHLQGSVNEVGISQLFLGKIMLFSGKMHKFCRMFRKKYILCL
jgi:hypothetical protein